MNELLFEIGTEEVPAKFMPNTLKQLKELAEAKFKELRISYDKVETYGTPRRMTFIATGINDTQENIVVESKGPSIKIAYGKDGEPSKAVIGFARGKGVSVEDLKEKDGYVYAIKNLEGQKVIDLLPNMLKEILESLTFPNNMRWANHEFRFVRPIRWMVALFNNEVIPVEITGVKSSNKSRGHRFMSSGEVEILNPSTYIEALRKEYVIVDQNERRENISKQIQDLMISEGGIAKIDEDLLEEVLYLVEYPTALCGKFDEKFLSLPKEAIITPMKDHQRYFPVIKENGELLAKFITVRNGGKNHLDTVAHGNARVLRARLSDAEFFFNEDRKNTLESNVEKLNTVVFQEGLGTLKEKSQRLGDFALEIKKSVNLDANEANLRRAALLSKADLISGMVCEFTELQGIMGREYALLDGENPEVAVGIYEHYLPRFAGDELPKHEIGRIISLADKIDNLVATFSRGLVPTGSQDPFALRRQTIGIVNILLDAQYHVSYLKLINIASGLLHISTDNAKVFIPKLREFINQRIKNIMLEQGIRYDVIEAVLTLENDDVVDLFARAHALNKYVVTENSVSCIQALSRAINIARKNEVDEPILQSLFEDDSEKELYALILKIDKEMMKLIINYNYEEILKVMDELVAPVNKFFDSVMVMAEDERVKTNRLAIAREIKNIAEIVGNISKIVIN